MAKTLHLRSTPEGAWQWRDDNGHGPVWYPLAESTKEAADYFTRAGVLLSGDWVTTHLYAKTQHEPVWDGESPEKWPVL